MSSWAENFTFAATWQLKHQLAYWKARAKALEYENGVLHDIIRKKNYVGPSTASNTVTESDSMHVETESGDDEEYEESGDENLEVSEEFIEFLQANAKFKEDARLERERLREQSQKEEQKQIAQLEAGPPEAQENREEVLKELYGDDWERIAALEMSLQTQFIEESDNSKPDYWPNIPFNFNFG
ncbi:gem-associated protein 8-like [Ostrinia nubilalis]|uniref:gem-associated protein 8-like n=1 Tax=Ostrinia nubilalis TaxID=29057 RepID=UPI0030823B7F